MTKPLKEPPSACITGNVSIGQRWSRCGRSAEANEWMFATPDHATDHYDARFRTIPETQLRVCPKCADDVLDTRKRAADALK
jgi:hypothetical protein